MSNISALLTSINEHYCSPPDWVIPMKRVLVPHGSGRRLLDPSSNGASIIGAHMTADGVTVNGLTVRRSDADAWCENPPYGTKIEAHTSQMAYWGAEVGVPGIGLLPSRMGSGWCQRDILGTADAWVHVARRFTFWVPIPIHERDAAPPVKDRNGKSKGKYYLRRWFPACSDADLPAPFRLLSPGFAVGPELGANGKPQSAPFDSLIPFWADPRTRETDPQDEIEALRELVRCAREPVKDMEEYSRDEASGSGDVEGMLEQAEALAQWTAEAERLLGSKLFDAKGPLDYAALEHLAESRFVDGLGDKPISVSRFAHHFRPLGVLTVAKGPRRGVYPQVIR